MNERSMECLVAHFKYGLWWLYIIFIIYNYLQYTLGTKHVFCSKWLGRRVSFFLWDNYGCSLGISYTPAPPEI